MGMNMLYMCMCMCMYTYMHMCMRVYMHMCTYEHAAPCERPPQRAVRAAAQAEGATPPRGVPAVGGEGGRSWAEAGGDDVEAGDPAGSRAGRDGLRRQALAERCAQARSSDRAIDKAAHDVS